MKTYQKMANLLQAIENCRQSDNAEWQEKHTEALNELVLNSMPSGSGFDCGTKLDGISTSRRLVFNTSYHHMDENGFYCGWTEHSVIVTASLASGFELRITGENKRDIKSYILDMFSECLDSDIPAEA